jgi:pyruvate,orthophosphate dikinase
MLGFRGCRLTIKFPEITLMQVKAIITAALEAQAGGAEVYPEIMIPLIATAKELEVIIPLVETEIQKVFAANGGKTVPYRLGTMIEVPRACLVAEKIAPFVSFISFGTNDLTQMTWGFSRDDVR